MVFAPDRSQTSVVLVGSFNPQIFQPAWFDQQSLLPSEEAGSAKIEIIHSEIVQFSTEWLELQVTKDRFSATSTEQPSEPLRDLLLGTFSLLQYTPVNALGVNLDAHFAMADEESWHRVGHTLVPPENWPALQDAGVLTVTEQGARTDGFEGYVRVKVEPSVLIRPGVYVQVNDHYQWQPGDGETALQDAMEVLTTGWRRSADASEALASAIIELGNASTSASR